MSDASKPQRVCDKRQACGNVCLHLQFGLSCAANPGDNICMIEAESRPADFLSPVTKKRMRQAKRIDTEGKAACVILKA